MADKTLEIVIRARDAASSTLKKISKLGKGLATIFGIGGAFEIGRRVVSGLADTLSNMASVTTSFGAELSAVGAIAGASTDEMEQLRRKALEMGAATVFSATEAASAQRQLAQAGQDTAQIIGSLPVVLRLAAAGEVALADAARLAATTIEAMKLEVNDLDDVVDQLAFTANNSATNVSEMAEALKFAVGSAGLIGASTEEVSAALGVLANNAVVGSRAGAGLNRMFAVLVGKLEEGEAGLKNWSVAVKDGNEEGLGLVQVLRNMRDAGISADDAFTIFGTRAGQVGKVLLDNIEEFESFIDASEKARESLAETGGYAEDVMRKKLDNLQGDVRLLSSAWESLSITLFSKGTPAMRAVVQQLTELISRGTEAAEGANRIDSAFRSLVGGMSSLVIGLIRAGEGLAVVWHSLRIAVLGTMRAITATVSGLAADVGKLYRLAGELLPGAIGDFYEDVADKLDAFAASQGSTTDAFTESIGESQGAIQEIVSDAELLIEDLKSIGDAARNAAAPVLQAGESFEVTGEKAGEAAEQVGAAAEATTDTIAKVEKALLGSGRITQSAADKLEEEFIKMRQAAEEQGVSFTDFHAAIADEIVKLVELAEASGVRLTTTLYKIRDDAVAAKTQAQEGEFLSRPTEPVDEEIPGFTDEEGQGIGPLLPTDEDAAAIQETVNQLGKMGELFELAEAGALRFSRAFASSVAAVAAGNKTIAEAAKALIRSLLGGLAQRALVKAAEEIALAFSALAGVVTAGAAGPHFAAAAKWTGVGALAAAASSRFQRGTARNPGFDSVNALIAPEEIVLDARSSRQVLAGQAALVSADRSRPDQLLASAVLGEDRAAREVHINASFIDGESGYEFLLNNADGVADVFSRADRLNAAFNEG